jgi:hypothetical protein
VKIIKLHQFFQAKDRRYQLAVKVMMTTTFDLNNLDTTNRHEWVPKKKIHATCVNQHTKSYELVAMLTPNRNNAYKLE